MIIPLLKMVPWGLFLSRFYLFRYYRYYAHGFCLIAEDEMSLE